ncbi:DUF4384 domain-containing protein [Myxococcota bacterium]|nr:DUF4384 domain-containing protein [Myxococcota bacterium]
MRWERLSSSCLSEYRMDRHLLCLEPEAERRESEAHIAACPRCRQEMAWLRQERADFLSHPAPPLALEQALAASSTPQPTPSRGFDPTQGNGPTWATASSRSQPTQPSRPWAIWASVATCSVALLLSLSLSSLWTPQHTIYRGVETPVFLIGLKRGAVIRQMASGESVKAGDHIRLAYQWRTQKPAYLYILHRDQEGRLSPLYPASAEQPSLRLDSPNETTLPGSLEFDQATHGHEEIWACFSRQPLHFRALNAQIPSPDAWAHQEPKPHGPCAYLLLYRFRRSPP